MSNSIGNNTYNPKINYIINPSDYIIIDLNKQIHNKNELSIEILSNSGCSEKVIQKLFSIKKKIQKNLVYGIKKKGNEYRIEIYLYKKNINNTSHQSVSNKDFKEKVKIVLNELGRLYNKNIDNLINTLEIYLISFDLDLVTGDFNNKLHIYLINDKKYYTTTYDIISNEISYESIFFRLEDYSDIKGILTNFTMIGLDGNWDKFINDMKSVNEKPRSIMFHYKYYNNNIGFYLIGNNYQCLDKFLKKYNYKNLYSNKEKMKDLSFDIAFNYDLITKKISGTGFSDYI
jgi:hypothetical protein